jgi:hypothetical protein
VESGSDVLSTVPADTPSSSHLSPSGSPQIELVVPEEDDDYRSGSPPVAIIGEEDIYQDQDPMDSLPLIQGGESYVTAAKRLGSVMQFGRFFHRLGLQPFANSYRSSRR